jgi:hypothetical protein
MLTVLLILQQTNLLSNKLVTFLGIIYNISMEKELLKTPEQEDLENLTAEDKQRILQIAEEGSKTIQETIQKAKRLTEETLIEKRKRADNARIEKLQKDFLENDKNRDLEAEDKKFSEDRKRIAVLHEEMYSLISLEKKSWKDIFKKPSYLETDETVESKEGLVMKIVTDKKGNKFACLEVNHQGENDNVYTRRIAKHYIPLEKAQPFLK